MAENKIKTDFNIITEPEKVQMGRNDRIFMIIKKG